MKHIHPTSQTGPDGVAVFKNLIPGNYTAILIRARHIVLPARK